MEFHEVTSIYDRARQTSKAMGSKMLDHSEDDFYRRLTRNLPGGLAREGNELAAVENERMWYRSGCPYYKVFPDMADMMSEISIDIPAGALHVPYPSFAIRLPKTENSFREEGCTDCPHLKWIMVYEMKVDAVNEDNFKYHIAKYPDNTKLHLQSGADRALFINYEFEGDYKGMPQAFNYTLSLMNEIGSIEEWFERSWKRTVNAHHWMFQKGEYEPSHSLVHRIMKLAIATAFFGIDEHEFVLPDLSRKKLTKAIARHGTSNLSADLKKARPDTKKWTIGREISLPRIVVERKPTPPEGRRELTHGYLRRGHMRWQRVGEGRKDQKLIFIHPHAVRDDLPMGKQHGYRIDDSNVETR